jgi:hypothetical protein
MARGQIIDRNPLMTNGLRGMVQPGFAPQAGPFYPPPQNPYLGAQVMGQPGMSGMPGTVNRSQMVSALPSWQQYMNYGRR